MVELHRKTSGAQGVGQEEKERSLIAITGSLNPRALLDADIVIEAAIENEATKKNIIASLSALGYRNLLVSNTSSISITRLASTYASPEQFMGMHFMNPVPIQLGCELIRGLLTSDETFGRVAAFCRELGKEPIVAEDKAGFGINRMFIPFLIEAARVIEEGVMSCEEADKTTLCLGHKMGPITTLDYVGLDTVVGIAEVLEKDLGPRYKAPDLLCKMAAAGFYGVKSGRGFYLWDQGSKVGVNPVVERYRRK
jgi:3-hydroxybutyryl-CoA dehydrogenase